MKIIGLTGGIASGKTTVARIFENLGAPVVDADELARDVVRPGEQAYREVVADFGTEILLPDGHLDRKALGRIVFADPAARKRLEAILHPAIGRKADDAVAELRRQEGPGAFYVAPLLIEAGVTSRVDEIWVVYVDRATQLERLQMRDGITREEAEQRLAAQMPMEEKAARGAVVIDNRGTFEQTKAQVMKLWQQLERQ